MMRSKKYDKNKLIKTEMKRSALLKEHCKINFGELTYLQLAITLGFLSVY